MDLDYAEVSQLSIRLRLAQQLAPRRLDDWLHNKIGPELVKEMKSKAPVASGKLRDAIRQVNGPGRVAVGTHGIGYIQYVVEGTRPHDIRPKGNALVFKIGGKTIFARVVHHPGTKANNFMEEAAKTVLKNNNAWMSGLGMELIKGG